MTLPRFTEAQVTAAITDVVRRFGPEYKYELEDGYVACRYVHGKVGEYRPGCI